MPRFPVCKIPTALIRYEQVPIHHCGGCGGHWLTDLKLDAILAGRDLHTSEAVNAKMIMQADASNTVGALHCISCGMAMVREQSKHWRAIQLDHCLRCDGLWLDRGELEKCQMYWERMQNRPDGAAANRIEQLAAIDADWVRRHAGWRDEEDRARARPPATSRVLTDLFAS